MRDIQTGFAPPNVVFKNDIALTVPPKSGFFALVTFLGLAVIAAAVLLVLAFRWGCWAEKKPVFVLLALLILGASVGAAHWTFVSTGYKKIAFSGTRSVGVEITVEVLQRVSNMMFLLALTLFVWLLLSAVIETVFTHRKYVSVVIATGLAVGALATLGYPIAMTIIHGNLQMCFIPDASGPLNSGVLFLFGAVLLPCGSCLATAGDEAKGRSRLCRNEAQRNHLLFVLGITYCMLPVVGNCGAVGAGSRLLQISQCCERARSDIFGFDRFGSAGLHWNCRDCGGKRTEEQQGAGCRLCAA